MSEQEKEMTAYHEAGHAIVGHALPDSDPVHKVTIIPRGGTGGVTWFLPPEDKSYTNVYEFKDILARCMGGHEVDVLRGGKLGGADEIALVFTVRVVCDQNDLPLSQILQCL